MSVLRRGSNDYWKQMLHVIGISSPEMRNREEI